MPIDKCSYLCPKLRVIELTDGSKLYRCVQARNHPYVTPRDHDCLCNQENEKVLREMNEREKKEFEYLKRKQLALEELNKLLKTGVFEDILKDVTCELFIKYNRRLDELSYLPIDDKEEK